MIESPKNLFSAKKTWMHTSGVPYSLSFCSSWLILFSHQYWPFSVIIIVPCRIKSVMWTVCTYFKRLPCIRTMGTGPTLVQVWRNRNVSVYVQQIRHVKRFMFTIFPRIAISTRHHKHKPCWVRMWEFPIILHPPVDTSLVVISRHIVQRLTSRLVFLISVCHQCISNRSCWC